MLAVVGCRGKRVTNSSPRGDEATPAGRLHLAARKGDLAPVQALIAGSCDIEIKGKNGYTPLHTAADYGQKRIVEFLISKGADVNAKSDTGGTALHLVAWDGNVDIAKLLIAAGADVNAGKERGRTPLYAASHVGGGRGEEEVAKLLLASGAEVVPGDTRENNSLLSFAVEHGLRDLVERLLIAGASANAMGPASGRTSLGEAVALGDKEIAALLIAHGADVQKKDYYGRTPLHYARHWSRDVAELLLTKGADVNTPGVLHEAVAAGEKEIVELFLAHGADVNAKNFAGETPLDEAIARGHKDIVEVLKKHGGIRAVPGEE